MLRRYKEYRLNEDGATTAPVVPNNKNNEIIDIINKMVDAWIYDLKKTLINPATAGNQRGIWDRFKNWMSNMWHGRYNAQNPYMWQNKLGDDLGRQNEVFEHFNPNKFSLYEYRDIKNICDSLEESINEEMNQEIPGTEKLKLVNIINQKAQELKSGLQKIILSKDQNSPAAPSQVAPPSPSKDPAPNLTNDEDEPDAGLYFNLTDRLLKMGAIDKNYHAVLNNKLKDPKTKQDAIKEIDDITDKNISSNNSLPDTKPNDTHEPVPNDDRYSYKNPPTTGKSWDQLDQMEQSAWDHYGGGLSRRRHRISSNEGEAESLKLPWIIRLGDPRREIYKNHVIIKGDKERHSGFWARLISQNRVESEKNPINSKAELNARVEELKKKLEERTPRMGEAPKPDVNQPSNGPTATAAPVKASAPIPPKPLHPSDKPPVKLAPITKEEPKIKHTDDNALGKPAHNSPIEEPDSKPEELKGKVLDMDKGRLKEKIEAIKDERQKESLLAKLDSAKDSSDLDKIEQILILMDEDF